MHNPVVSKQSFFSPSCAFGNIIKGVICMLLVIVQSVSAQQKIVNTPVRNWGDMGDGTYKNPILNADYSDPDVIRVGNVFYMVCSDFHFMGMPILKSTDLVNWTIIGRVYNRFDMSKRYDEMNEYGGGSWAPSLRYHDNKFYIYFCTPDEGLYMTTATNPAGQWAPLTEVKRVSGWEDPCPFWDSNGQAYLGHSRLGAGPIIIHKMSSDGKHLLDSGKVVYEGQVAEGTKIYKRNNYYYLIIPEGGVGTGYETALRSKDIYGPYERKVVLEQGNTAINGPHQGGMVELPSGESWFIHFQSAGAIGRICHLEPVKWINDWPFIGKDNDGNGIGEPVSQWAKPVVAIKSTVHFPQSSDEFNSADLGLQWQWNHNPDDANWSLKKFKGYLSITAGYAVDCKSARNTITQKLTGYNSVTTTMLLATHMADGQKAGLCLFGGKIYEIGLIKSDASVTLYEAADGKITKGENLPADKVYLRLIVNTHINKAMLQYSLNGKDYKQLGDEFNLPENNYWKGVRPALFSYNTKGNRGDALFNWFHYDIDNAQSLTVVKNL